MKKKEIIWREILEKSIRQKQFEFTQQALARQFGFSLSTVFNALATPRAQGAVKVAGRSFAVSDIEKFLYIWATQRKLESEVIYSTAVPQSALEIEGQVPAGVVFGAWSAYRHRYGAAPAEYDSVYLYANAAELVEIKKRFPARVGRNNLFVLKKDPWLDSFGGGITPDTQAFVDLWNIRAWQAKDFLAALKAKILA